MADFKIGKAARNIITAVILTILIGIVIVLPMLNKARENIRHVSCASNLHAIGLCFKQYAMDYKNYFPDKDGWNGFEYLRTCAYLTDRGIYICPSTLTQKGKLGPLRRENISYVYFGGLIDKNEFANMPLAFDIPGNHQECISVLFLDGHVRAFETNAKNCRNLIEFLDSRIHYSPEHLKLLYEKADTADRMYDLK